MRELTAEGYCYAIYLIEMSFSECGIVATHGTSSTTLSRLHLHCINWLSPDLPSVDFSLVYFFINPQGGPTRAVFNKNEFETATSENCAALYSFIETSNPLTIQRSGGIYDYT